MDDYESFKNKLFENLIIRSPFSKVASLQDFTISVVGSIICCSETARNLGVIFDSAMNLESQLLMFVKLLISTFVTYVKYVMC